MKNLLVFIGPNPFFTKEHEELTKMQIDNSLELGWKVEDLLLVTNFNFEYRGVKALEVEGCYYDKNKFYRSSKVPAILKLFDLGLINDLVWFHDHDAFQLEPMRDPELGDCDAGFADHGWQKKWNAGSFFFKPSSRYIFQAILDTMNEQNIDEQDALTYLWENKKITNYKLLNITWNVGIYHLYSCILMSERPLMVAHFHPHKPRHLLLFRKLLPKRLLVVFGKYGIQ